MSNVTPRSIRIKRRLPAQSPDYRDSVNGEELALVINAVQRIFPTARLVGAVRPGPTTPRR